MTDSLAQIYYDYDNDPAFENLRGKGIHLVPGAGETGPGGLMFIGEAPGEHENNQLVPFVGKAGKIWEKQLLPEIGVSRNQVFITNIVKYRPMNPQNRNPSPYEIDRSIPYLTREINVVNPKIIIPMGRISTQAFFPSAQPQHVRGKPHDRRGRIVIPTFHPAAMIYVPAREEDLKVQFRLIRDVILGV